MDVDISATPTQSFFGRTRLTLWVTLAVLYVVGLGVRLADLTDPPLDFHPTRQLRSAIIAREMYLEMLPATDPALLQKASETVAPLEILEPPAFERLVAATYFVTGGERLWVARLYAILFWGLGGVPLFALARRMTGTDGAVLALAYYLFLPFALTASRSFQPDPLVTMLLAWSLWALYRWGEEGTWKWAAAAGLVSGLAIYAKVTAGFFILPAAFVIALTSTGWRAAIRNRQVWVILLFLIVIPSSYYIFSIGSRAAGYASFWNVSFLQQVLQPRFYVFWASFLGYLMSFSLVIAGLIGVALFRKNSQRLLVLALWIGYFLYGLAFPYQINTHEYYSLMFVPVLALSLSPIGNWIGSKAAGLPGHWQAYFLGVLLFALAYPAWISYTGLIGKDYRGEVVGWRLMGEALPPEGDIIGLTHDYGTRIGYYGWRAVALWPTQADFDVAALRSGEGSPEFERLFEQKTAGKEFFLVTLMGEFEAQPALKAMLTEQYPVYAQGAGYIVFDLRQRR